MIRQIYKSNNITISRDMDPNNNDPYTCIIIEEHTTDKKVILDELIDELQKPYSFKLEIGWEHIVGLALTLPCLHLNNLVQKVDGHV